jgi:peptidoglycan-associated lipoprotein
MGERRAKAAANVLLKEGVADARLRTVSHGSDHPVCAEKTDACAAKNRRVHFRVKKP